jgi:hypothetical protein
VINGQTVLVDPRTHRIVDIINYGQDSLIDPEDDDCGDVDC